MLYESIALPLSYVGVVAHFSGWPGGVQVYQWASGRIE
jgi:hypothetical protein